LSPDGTRVVYASHRAGKSRLFVKSSAGLGTEQQIAEFPDGVEASPQDWSSDGRTILYGIYSPRTSWDIGAIPAAGGTAQLMLDSEHGERDGKLSPDMKWIAYDSTESGRREIWIQPMPPNGSRRQISTEGAFSPRWRGDGQELFYIAADGAMMAVPFSQGSVGVARKLFMTVRREGGGGFAVTSDGRRFLVKAPPQIENADPITVLVNWRSKLLQQNR